MPTQDRPGSFFDISSLAHTKEQQVGSMSSTISTPHEWTSEEDMMPRQDAWLSQDSASYGSDVVPYEEQKFRQIRECFGINSLEYAQCFPVDQVHPRSAYNLSASNVVPSESKGYPQGKCFRGGQWLVFLQDQGFKLHRQAGSFPLPASTTTLHPLNEPKSIVQGRQFLCSLCSLHVYMKNSPLCADSKEVCIV